MPKAQQSCRNNYLLLLTITSISPEDDSLVASFLGGGILRRADTCKYGIARTGPSIGISHCSNHGYTLIKGAEMLDTSTRLQNHMLASLPVEAQRRLHPHLELELLPLGKVLCESGDTMRHVFFPADAIVSLLYIIENGASAEISVVGNEGVIGIALFMGGNSTPSRALVRSAGYAYRLPGQKFKDECNRHADLMMLMLRYTQALITQMCQTAVCNRHHSIIQQLCRWLLLSLDRQAGNHLTMTQEHIANMLGVRREGVTEAAGKLQKLGVIEYSRGRITVLDRPNLEKLCCECYAVVKTEINRLLPYLPQRQGKC